MKLSPKQRETVYAMFEGHCAYCGQVLPLKGWHADHVKAVCREWWNRTSKTTHSVVDGKMIATVTKIPVGMLHPHHDVIENIFPACRACNIDKSVSDLEDWRKQLERRPQVLRDNYSAYRHAERFGLVAQVNTKVIFYFEQFVSTK